MSTKLRKSTDRGFYDHGFLKTYHTFSFADYFIPMFHNFRNLRVLNEDLLMPGAGFPPHDHKDMDIITIVQEGTLAHKDSTGTEETIKPNQIQYMSAGTGVTHSEYNASKTESVHFFQIWLIPNQKNLEPSYNEITVDPKDRKNKFQLIASNDGPIKTHQDSKLFLLDIDKEITYDLNKGRGAWLHLIMGSITVNGVHMERGDGVSVEDEPIVIKANVPSHIILFDLA